jgi:hypothetical protein
MAARDAPTTPVIGATGVSLLRLMLPKEAPAE